MAGGRGSASPSLAIGVALICLMLITEPALGAVYYVGGSSGWTFNTNKWPNGKSFKAGDVLVFKYARGAHNVVPVNSRGYNSCSSPRGARLYQSGKDILRLRRGHNYFLCSIPGHCQGGMKIDVYAA